VVVIGLLLEQFGHALRDHAGVVRDHQRVEGEVRAHAEAASDMAQVRRSTQDQYRDVAGSAAPTQVPQRLEAVFDRQQDVEDDEIRGRALLHQREVVGERIYEPDVREGAFAGGRHGSPTPVAPAPRTPRRAWERVSHAGAAIPCAEFP
jgi:hypothetical protein